VLFPHPKRPSFLSRADLYLICTPRCSVLKGTFLERAPFILAVRPALDPWSHVTAAFRPTWFDVGVIG